MKSGNCAEHNESGVEMIENLQPGMTFEFRYKVIPERTVPYLYPDIEEATIMPEVFATGYMVGLMEFACIKFINTYIDWPRQQTVWLTLIWIPTVC